MITCQLQGRCGNQMFIIAATVAHALRNGDSFSIPRQTAAPSIWDMYFGQFPNYEIPHPIVDYYQKNFYHEPIPYSPVQKLMGYFQSEKYFKEYREEIMKWFDIPYSRDKGVVSIHVRRGDYLDEPDNFPVLPLQYYRDAIRYFQIKGFNTFRVFSDDIKWCPSFFNYVNFPDTGFIFSAYDNSAITDLAFMSSCEHNIIANSTFSWWGAWLNQNPDKIVVAPKIWFGEKNGFYGQSQDVLPEEWIQI